MTSQGAFMSGKALFLKNGFQVADTSGDYTLLVKSFGKGTLPKFRNWEKQQARYQGFHILYSHQCPWVARSIGETKEVLHKNNIAGTFTELKALLRPSVHPLPIVSLT